MASLIVEHKIKQNIKGYKVKLGLVKHLILLYGHMKTSYESADNLPTVLSCMKSDNEAPEWGVGRLHWVRLLCTIKLNLSATGTRNDHYSCVCDHTEI